MNTAKILLGILLLSITNTTTAQDSDHQPQADAVSSIAVDTTIVTYELINDPQLLIEELTKKVIKKEVSEHSITVVSSPDTHKLSLTIDTSMVNLSEVEDRLVKKGLLLIPPKIKKEEPAIEMPEEVVEKYDPQIDRFLNLEDTTIFTIEFMSLDSLAIHRSRRDYYHALQKIHDFGDKLARSEYNISETRIRDLAAQANASVETARGLLLDEAKQYLAKAQDDLIALIPYKDELELLSPAQKTYYENLKNKFNALSRKINPD